MSQPTCVDCIAEGVTTIRPIASGTRKPRCATHTRAARKRAQINAHGRTVEKQYGLSKSDYWTLYALQRGVCAICRVATGKTKRLAVDHDHKTGEPRGLLCGPCNQMIGRLGTDAFVRAINYLHDPPARMLTSSVTSTRMDS